MSGLFTYLDAAAAEQLRFLERLVNIDSGTYNKAGVDEVGAVLAAGLPESVPAVTVDRQCGSGQQAVSFAVHGIQAGAYRLVIAGGVESMSQAPMPPSFRPGAPLGSQYSPRELARYQDNPLIPQGVSSELLNSRFGLTRETLDASAVRSHKRAHEAIQAGRIKDQLVHLTEDPADPNSPVVATDEAGRTVKTFIAATGELGLWIDYTLENMAPGKWTITLTSPGDAPVSQTVNVKSGETVAVPDFSLACTGQNSAQYPVGIFYLAGTLMVAAGLFLRRHGKVVV